MNTLVFSLLASLFFLSNVYGSSSSHADRDHARKHYIVYMGSHSLPTSESVMSANHDLLASVTNSRKEAEDSIVYHFHKSFRGFSAMLTPQQARELRDKDSVVLVAEDEIVNLQTVRSWDFMGDYMPSAFSLNSWKSDHDVIVGHFDSGIWPESPSFKDDGFGPVPKRWKGHCSNGTSCNNKVIGYRWYYRGHAKGNGTKTESSSERFYRSARDVDGHGTHTASTAVGLPINDVCVPGIGDGNTVRGGAPGARLSVYKVCWFDSCACSDITKAFDDAIHDGVDVITASIGGITVMGNPDFLNDCLGIGSLHAFQKGIVVSASAGNSHFPETVTNAAPWILTVGAASDDRVFYTRLELGNSLVLKGRGFNLNDKKEFHEIATEKNSCREDTLDERSRGKIVVCAMDRSDEDKAWKAKLVKEKGGVGVIIIDPHNSVNDTNHHYVIPTIVIGVKDADLLDAYMKSSVRPSASIHPHNVQYHSRPAPKMADFSSRGPGTAPDIIKPDVIAPGVNIVSSYPPWDGTKPATPTFKLMSGTSMSCPHASGVAATIKGARPDLSPAAIKSAIMTSTFNLDNMGGWITSNGGVASPFDMGSGHLYPSKALNPGLIYDYNMTDVVSYLCNMVDSRKIENMVGTKVNCSSAAIPTYNLNYPSIGISNLRSVVRVRRTATFVGSQYDSKVFYLSVQSPAGIWIEVEPGVLDFSDGNKTKSYEVKVIPLRPYMGQYVFGSITWYNYNQTVRSPIAVRAI